tara:strand:+ start:3088 stop:3729 length:642 start_codon:yes stop_codon:yes gene_type:complete
MVSSAQAPVPERLLQAAIEVFSTRGYNAARVSDIVARAGVAQGTFYLYFENKKAIFLHVIDDFFDRLLGETLGRYPAAGLNGQRDLKEQLRQMWRLILKRCREEPLLTSLVLREAYALGPETRKHVDEHFTHVVGAISTYLQEVSARGIIRPGLSVATAWVVLGMIERAIHYAVSLNPQADVDRLADEFLSIELGGLLGFSEFSLRSEEAEDR